MDRKYQVFVSSIYEDLQEERQEVMHVLLELDCIPSGMELFPAADEDQWSLIKGVIDDCDYYIVIIAGRYGSIGPDGVGYTEMEYRYAVEKGKPVVAFLHGDPDSIPSKDVEKTEEGKEKLEAFRDLARQKMCKEWTTPHELGSVVARSLTRLTKMHPAVGWVRGDQVPGREATEEILSLRKKIERLESMLHEARTEAPPGTEQFAQGGDTFEISLLAKFYDGGMQWEAPYTTTLSWDEIFYTVLPLMIHEANELSMRKVLEEQFLPEIRARFSGNHGHVEVSCRIDTECFRTIVVQLRALGLMKSTRPNCWTLTPYGDNVMNRLRAITRAGTDGNT